MSERGSIMLHLSAARFRLGLEVVEPMVLPPYKGSTLRGGFGGVFRRIACSQRQLAKCGGCLLKGTCPYGFIFESGPPEGSELWGSFQEIPRPFVIEPPESEQSEFKPGERIEFDLVLIGKAIDYLPYFILVFKELGEIGIGKRRAKFRLGGVDSVGLDGKPGERVFDGEKVYNRFETVRSMEPSGDGVSGTVEELVIDFRTMTRLKQGGNYAESPEFGVLLRALFRRISALQYFYCGERLELDFSGMLERAGEVKLMENETKWVDWERYSSRQDARMTLGGLVGRARYEGPWREFEEFLRWGEMVHVGKGATFGLGRVRIG
jgi:hypothetical protein